MVKRTQSSVSSAEVQLRKQPPRSSKRYNDYNLNKSPTRKRRKAGNNTKNKNDNKNGGGRVTSSKVEKDEKFDLSPEPVVKPTEICNAKKIKSATMKKAPVITVNINDLLPDNLLVGIFSYLSAQQRIRIERVCRKWNDLSKKAWYDFDRIDFASFAPDFSTYPPPGCGFSTHSPGSSASSAAANIVNTLNLLNTNAGGPLLPGLQMWSLWRRPLLNNTTLKSILTRCRKHLKELDLSGYRDSLDYRILPVVGEYCPNLEIINLTGILVTNSSLRSLAVRCRKLRSVIFQRCFQDSIIDRGLSCLLSNCTQLESLNLSENERITGSCFNDLPSSLKYLVLSTCYELKDDGVRALADRCPNLEVLHLDSCDHVTAHALEYAFRKLSKLRVLHLGEYYATSQGVQVTTLCELSRLRELYLNDNYLVTDNTLDSIAFACVNLEKFDISGGNKAITDQGLINLCRLKHLTKLNLSYLCRITDVGVQHLARHGRLDVLLLHRCLEISDESAFTLAKYCMNLTKLDMSRCVRVTDAAIWAFYRYASRKNCRLSLCVGRTGVTMKEKDIFHLKLDLNFADYTFYWSQFRGNSFD